MRLPAVGLMLLLVSLIACTRMYGTDAPASGDDSSDAGNEASLEPAADASADSSTECQPAPITCPDAGHVCDTFDSEDSRTINVIVSGNGSWAIAGGEGRLTATNEGDGAYFIGATPRTSEFAMSMRLRRKQTASRVEIAAALGQNTFVAGLRVNAGMLEQCVAQDACVEVGPWTDDVWHTVRWTLTKDNALAATLDCGPPVETLARTSLGSEGFVALGISRTDGPASVAVDVARID